MLSTARAGITAAARRAPTSRRWAAKMMSTVSVKDRYHNFIFDCDGVLWSGNTPIPGSLESVAELQAAGKNVIFVTNNATKTRKTYTEKFAKLGLEVDIANINTAGSFAADWCQKQGFDKVFAIGHEGMMDELKMRGLQVLQEDGCQGMADEDFLSVELDPAVKAVVVGWDKDFSMRKLCLASLYLQKGAAFVVTNPDSADRMKSSDGNRMQPGTGCYQAAIAFSVGLPPEKITVCGKPNQGFLDNLLDKYDFKREETLMTGDRLNTDIYFGGGKIDTMLVMTGVSLQEDVDALGDGSTLADGEFRPQYVAANVQDAVAGKAEVLAPSHHPGR